MRKNGFSTATTATLPFAPTSSLMENSSYASPYPQNKTIQDLFESQVKKTPNNIAITFKDLQLTYKELNQKANQLAQTLRNMHSKPLNDVLIGLCVERSLEMIIGILGIIKAGAAYLPLDPTYPKDRLEFMLKDSKTKIVLAQKQILKQLPFLKKNHQTICLDNDWNKIELAPKTNPKNINSTSDLVYIIYTSGSTGIPKGTLIEHHGVCNLASVFGKQLKIKAKTRLLQFASISFDASVAEWAPTLLNGGILQLLSADELPPNMDLIKVLSSKKTQVVTIPPAVLETLQPTASLSSLHTLVSAGDKCSLSIINRWAKNRTFINAYGPTECTVCSTLCVCNPGIEPNIGKAIENVKAYILDKNLNPTPIGAPGELYIGGVGLGRGYLNRPELTNERFVENPFNPTERLYKTGDLVRWLPDGNIDFIGRVDFQVKIRGFRIELGEIDAILQKHPQIRQCLTIAHGETSDKQLVSYYISRNDKDIDTNSLKQLLNKRLPEYMVPSIFIQLSAFPLNHSGKIDRKALPKPETVTISRTSEYVAPRNAMEQDIANIWTKVLSRQDIGIHDNFFDIGGHSLNATQISTALSSQFSLPCQVQIIFGNPTIAELAQAINSKLKVSSLSIPPIRAIEKDKKLTLSFAEQRLWFFDQYDTKYRAAYNIPFAVLLNGSLKINILEKTLDFLIERHEALRTVYPNPKQNPKRKIVKPYKIILKPETITSSKLNNRLLNESQKTFDIINETLIRVKLFKLKTDEFVLFINQHHLITDGWSVEVFINELNTTYNALLQKQKAQLPELKVQYADYAYWEKEQLLRIIKKPQLAYWRKKLAGFTELDLPTDYPRPTTRTYNGKQYLFTIEKELSHKLNDLAAKTKTTLFMLTLSVFKLLLSKYSGQDDIIVGSPIANRNYPDLENILGFFVNTLALRTDLSENLTFSELLKKVKETCLGAYEYQDLPFDFLVDQLQITRDLSRSPIFQTMFIVQSAGTLETLNFKNITATRINVDPGFSLFDLIVELIDLPEGIQCSITYNTDLYKASSIETMVKHYEVLLNALVKDQQQKISALSLLTPEEQQQILIDWNKSKIEIPENMTVQGLFENQTNKTPAGIAITSNGKKLTYEKLNQKANQLAHTLRKAYAKPLNDVLIGLCVERGLEMMIGILGIIKAGAAYLPLDPTYPEDRLKFMLKDSKAKIVLTQSHISEKLPVSKQQIRVICLDKDWDKKIAPASITNPENINKAKDLIYAIYTSGSTGVPKGTLIEHRGVIRLANRPNYISISSGDFVAHASSISFDAATLEIWGAMINGANLVCVDNETLLDIDSFSDFLATKKITILWLTAALFEQYALAKPSMFKKLSYLLAGGDVLNPLAINNILTCKQGHPRNLVNGYGPTENTTFTTTYKINEPIYNQARVPIGKFIAGTIGYILDKHLNPVPIGIPGELYIGGEGLGRGYLNRPKLTKEKFIENPFNSKEHLYKTGDLVKWLPDGNIDFIGRVDFQVKIRGFRIELGEIDARLLTHSEIKQCITTVTGDASEKNLVTYYISKNGKDLDIAQVKSFLAEQLPDYMVPMFFIRLNEMPLNPSGKIDRKALPKPDEIATSSEYIAPQNQAEAVLQEIWQDILKRKRISIKDNFFSVGGNSLNAIQVTAKVNKKFKSSIGIKTLFEHPTIAELEDILTARTLQSKTLKQLPIKAAPQKGKLTLSFAEQRMWFLNQYETEDSATYNIPIAFNIHGKLDIKILEQSLNLIIDRHEILRTCYITTGKITERSVIKQYQIELKPKTILKHNLKKLLSKEAKYPFALDILPLFRIQLFKTNNKSHILLINQHHIISDGLSLTIFLEELNEIYTALINNQEPNLTKLEIQYADYAYWQKQWLKGEILKTQVDYWKQKLADAPRLDLPTDFPRPAVKTYQGKHYQFLLSPKSGAKAKQLAETTGTTLFMIMLTMFKILMTRYSNQEDIVVGSPIAGRVNPALDNIMGLFVNTLALRSNLTGNPTFSELLLQVKTTCLDAYAHQDVPFEKLVEELNIERNVSYTPIFQVMFSLQSMAEQITLKLPETKTDNIKLDYDIAKFDLTLNALTKADNIGCEIEYNTDLFTQDSIKRMAKHFNILFDTIIENPAIKIHDIPLLTHTEQLLLLRDWNQTELKYPHNKTIQELFELQAKKTPKRFAVIFNEHKLTYKELNQKANQLAHTLRKLHPEPLNDILIGLCVERSLEMMIGILGIIKSGAAYLPLDPNYPEDRLKFMLKDSKTNIVLTQNAILEKRPTLKQRRRVIALDSGWDKIGLEAKTNPKRINKNSDLAYVIYTSGSTGTPKGVMIEHKAVLNLSTWMQSAYNFNSKDKILLKTPFTFDVSIAETFVPVIAGMPIVIAKPDGHKDPNYLIQTIDRYKITVIQFVPSMLALFLQAPDVSKLKSLRYCFVAGEAFPPELVKQTIATLPWCEIYNLYGPTEDTVYASFWQCHKNLQTTPIGKPLANTKFYVLDSYMQPTPIGIPGELHIGGEGLARGYLNRTKLTKEKFIENPLNPKERLYKTGDLVKWLHDGNIDFLGRIDHQVKIRGFRIELGEIDAAILKYPNIKQCITVVTGSANNKILVSYFVTRQNQALKIESLKTSLIEQLPDYMVPTFFIKLDKMPLNQSGKIDRKALPDVDMTLTDKSSYETPKDSLAIEMQELWQKVLKRKHISIKDDFFALGGNSLLAVQLMMSINQHFNINNAVAWVFRYSTIEKQTNALREQNIKIHYKPVIGVNTSGTKPPIFFIHGGTSGAEMYLGLANILPKNQPFYAVESYNIYSGKKIVTSIKKLAAIYLEFIQEVQPRGPYYLGGWSLGGLLAFEIAQQLKKQGQKIAKVYLIDTYNLQHDESKQLLAFVRKEKELIRFDTDMFKNLPPQYREHIEEVGYEEMVAMASYKAKDYDGDVVLFKSSKFDEFRPKTDTIIETSYKLFAHSVFTNMANGWKHVAPNLEIYPIPATHKTIVENKALKKIVKIMLEI